VGTTQLRDRLRDLGFGVLVADVVDHAGDAVADEDAKAEVAETVSELCGSHPIYQ
jgi:hypothetical protein